jgi:hypothetical protein
VRFGLGSGLHGVTCLFPRHQPTIAGVLFLGPLSVSPPARCDRRRAPHQRVSAVDLDLDCPRRTIMHPYTTTTVPHRAAPSTAQHEVTPTAHRAAVDRPGTRTGGLRRLRVARASNRAPILTRASSRPAAGTVTSVGRPALPVCQCPAPDRGRCRACWSAWCRAWHPARTGYRKRHPALPNCAAQPVCQQHGLRLRRTWGFSSFRGGRGRWCACGG